jgi:hypothetical protein
VENVTAEQYAIELQENGDWIQFVASPDKAEIQRHWRHLRAMGVQAPIRLVGFDVLRDSRTEATTA